MTKEIQMVVLNIDNRKMWEKDTIEIDIQLYSFRKKKIINVPL